MVVKGSDKILLIITGLLFGFVIQSVLEILAILVLTNFFYPFFVSVSWRIWIGLHIILTLLFEGFGILLTYRISKMLQE